jgi:predicted alpha-1,2-mannosidase
MSFRKLVRLSAFWVLACLLLFLSACINPIMGDGSGQNAALGIVRRSASDVTQYVNPMIGTDKGGSQFGFNGDGGNTFPGAAYPMGMVSWSPDTPSHIPGGYNYQDSAIEGFSLTHFSGRGCQVYQDIPFMPYVGNLAISPAQNRSMYSSAFSHSNEQAFPGYYGVHLDGPNVDAAFTVTARTGMAQFTYPSTTNATLLVNTGGSVKGNSAATALIDPRHAQISGSATSTVGCGNASYTIYFVAQFDQPFSKVGTWQGMSVRPNMDSSSGSGSGAYVTFDMTSQQKVSVRVGVSYVSVGNAQANLQAENRDASFTSIAQQASDAWNARLSSIQVGGGSTAQKQVFYTALYHTFFHPNIFSDANGQYLGFDNQVHFTSPGHIQYHDIPAWDQYRSLAALRALLAPNEASDVVRSLLNDAQQGDGHLPRWEQTNHDSHGMNGDGADAWIASALAFGASDFDKVAVLQAMEQGQPKIREGLQQYLNLGYLPYDVSANGSAVTEEYSADDFSIAQVALALGKTTDYQQYLQQSEKWRNVFNPVSGYIQPRLSSGGWLPAFTPTSQKGFQEGDSAQYTWMVTFNLPGLVTAMGGNARAVSRLDSFFTQLNAGPSSQYAFMGNEPGFSGPWTYDFAGAPSHTQAVVRRIQTQWFTATPGGLPGNDDGGAMSSWYVFSALGFYPEVPGEGGFVIGSPVFPSATIHLAGGHDLNIQAQGAQANAPYVQSMSLNGVPTSQLWLSFASVKQGGTLSFVLGTQASSWGSAAKDSPPNFATPIKTGS